MKKVMITGSSGLLGQKLVLSLRKYDGVQIFATDISENRLKEKEGYVFEQMDITDRQMVLDAVDNHKPDFIINTAALTDVDACEREKELCWNVNVEAVGHLTEACEKHNAHLIHLSTDFIFDGEKGIYKENDKPNPLSYYGESKLTSEKLLRKSGIRWSVIRTIIIYGTAENLARTNVVLWAKEALEKGAPMYVVDDQFRAPTLAEDLADACIQAAINRAAGIYHVSGNEVMSILELVHRVAAFYGLDKSVVTPVSSDTLNQLANRPPRTGFVLDKAIRELNYSPRSFEEGLQILSKQLAESPGH